MKNHEKWLSLTQEGPLEPEMPICDPHHHLWDKSGRRYLTKQLLADIAKGHNVVSTVFVESGSVEKAGNSGKSRPELETKFAHDETQSTNSGIGSKTRVAAGIVGYADLTLARAVLPVLEAHLAASSRFRGIRQIITWDPSPEVFSPGTPGLLSDTNFRKGYACLKKYNITFETFLYHPQMQELVDLARVFPEAPVILEHVGGPLGIGPYAGKRKEVYQDWKKTIAAVAACRNTLVKLGGLGMPSCGFNWNRQPAPPTSEEMASVMAPYILWCIECFGVDRCMFESNFPVERESCSYTVLWNAFKRIVKNFSTNEKAALFHDTAVKIYRL
jgi:predicted TIM-barrel fold metal-dependent hydrolase